MARGWHVLRSADRVCVTRRLPVRFDVAAEVRLEVGRPVGRGAVAQQVRQDLWRALQTLRGFSPAVEVRHEGSALVIRAGGRIDGRVPSGVAARIEAVLTDPARQLRWVGHAGRRPVPDDAAGGVA